MTQTNDVKFPKPKGRNERELCTPWSAHAESGELRVFSLLSPLPCVSTADQVHVHLPGPGGIFAWCLVFPPVSILGASDIPVPVFLAAVTKHHQAV
jgi:hypothetical protein